MSQVGQPLAAKRGFVPASAIAGMAIAAVAEGGGMLAVTNFKVF